MPAGWVHGRLGEIAIVTDAEDHEPISRRIEKVMTELLAGDHDGFVAWVGEQTMALAHAHDLAMRDADLETVIQFMQAKARRTRPFTTPGSIVTGKQIHLDAALLFTEESGSQP